VPAVFGCHNVTRQVLRQPLMALTAESSMSDTRIPARRPCRCSYGRVRLVADAMKKGATVGLTATELGGCGKGSVISALIPGRGEWASETLTAPGPRRMRLAGLGLVPWQPTFALLASWRLRVDEGIGLGQRLLQHNGPSSSWSVDGRGGQGPEWKLASRPTRVP
jgi:hypothetical protein